MVYWYIDLAELKSKILHAKFHEHIHITSGSEVFTINRRIVSFVYHSHEVQLDEKTQGQTKPGDNLFFKPLTCVHFPFHVNFHQ